MQTALPVASGLTNEDKAKLWAAADKLRGHMDAAEYKHIVLGLIFLNTSPTPSKSTTPSSMLNDRKGSTRRTRTSTPPKGSSGCLPMLAGPCSKTTPSSRPSAP